MRLFMLCLTGLLAAKAFSQNVGIGTTTPNTTALLHIDLGTSTTKGFLVTGTYNFPSTFPDLGSGSRMMFYPGKAAFRAGYVDGTQWDNANVGVRSVAFGLNTIASGNASTALGYFNTASGTYSFAAGDGSVASGSHSIAMGLSASGAGSFSTAIGSFTQASGDFATGMGYKVDANMKGSFLIGDSDPNNEGITQTSLPDAFVARFNNGFYLVTSGNMYRSGVQITHNGNAWVSMCDVNLKENFEPLNGEDVLNKLSTINFTSWNYKQQDPKQYRHYGIMAQDFYNAFGHDKYGTIGNDTTVNPIDMIGIDMTAIQALERRTEAMQGENEKLKVENSALKTEVEALNDRLKKVEELLQKKE